MTENRHIRKQRRAHKLIVREGQQAVLRDPSGDQACFVLEEAFSPREIDGSLIQLGDRRFLLSPLTTGDSDELNDLSPSPHKDQRLVLEDPDSESGTLELIMASPPGRLCPATIVIYYELHCRLP